MRGLHTHNAGGNHLALGEVDHVHPRSRRADEHRRDQGAHPSDLHLVVEIEFDAEGRLGGGELQDVIEEGDEGAHEPDAHALEEGRRVHGR